MKQLENLNQWQALHALLKEKKKAVQDEILHYPPPIPACDQQFNHLLEQRAQLSQALRQLSEQRRDNGRSLLEIARVLGCLSESEIEQLAEL
ncbi:MAG: hypothetical protein AAF490_16690 [Chloroflexota bacterium]